MGTTVATGGICIQQYYVNQCLLKFVLAHNIYNISKTLLASGKFKSTNKITPSYTQTDEDVLDKVQITLEGT